MENLIVLSKIARLIGSNGFIKSKQGEILSVLRCCGLDEFYDRYELFLEPYRYKYYNGQTYQNDNEAYNITLALDSLFRDIMSAKPDKIVEFLNELAMSLNVYKISENVEEFNCLGNLYQLMGIELFCHFEKIICIPAVSTFENTYKIECLMEKWLSDTHPSVYESYGAALDSYMNSNPGACIESCRTTLVSLFSQYKGLEPYAKWMRGIYEISEESEEYNISELSVAINNAGSHTALAEFFGENANGKLTKTKAVYAIYAMMSDYGTHKDEGKVEVPTMDDALFMLRLLTCILSWVCALQTK